MRALPYLILSLLSAGVLAPLGLALCLRRVEPLRVALACLGALACAALLWRGYGLLAPLLPGLLAFAVGEVRKPLAWGRGLLLLLGQALIAQGLALLLVGGFFHGTASGGLLQGAPPAAFFLLGGVFLALGVGLVEWVVRRWARG